MTATSLGHTPSAGSQVQVTTASSNAWPQSDTAPGVPLGTPLTTQVSAINCTADKRHRGLIHSDVSPNFLMCSLPQEKGNQLFPEAVLSG